MFILLSVLQGVIQAHRGWSHVQSHMAELNLKTRALCASVTQTTMIPTPVPWGSVSSDSRLLLALASKVSSLSITRSCPPSPGQCGLIVLSGWGLGRASQFGQPFSGHSQSKTETAGWPDTPRFLKSSQPLSPVRHSISQHGVSIRHFMLSQSSPNYNWFWQVFAGAVKFFICPPSEAVFYIGERAPRIHEKSVTPDLC